MPVAGQEIHVGAAHRAVQQLVAHGPAVDEEILLQRRWRDAMSAGPRSPTGARPRARRRRGSALSWNSAPITCARRAAGLRIVRARAPVEAREMVAAQREAHVRIAPWRGARRHRPRPAPPRAALLRNLSRAGVAENRSRTSTRVPNGCGGGRTGCLRALIDADAMGLRARPRARDDVERARPSRWRAAPRRESRAWRCGTGRRRGAWRWRGARPPARDRRRPCRRRRR